MNDVTPPAADHLTGALRQLLGTEHVQTGGEDGMDLHVWPGALAPICVARPANAAEIASVVGLAAAAGVSIVPRGAGLSYTGGTICTEPHIKLDTMRLDHIELHPEDRYAVVGAGCSWGALAEALRPHGLRVPLGAPISGNVSTIGGAVSQNVPGSLDAVIGLRVVLADGSLLTTGSAGVPGRSAFYRNAGPDLTGMFMGDCGAFGIKTEVVLRLAPLPHVALGSFAFADPVAMIAGLAELQRIDAGATCMALDPTRSADAIRSVGLGDALRTGLAMLRRGRSPFGLLRRPRQGWSLHVTVESASAAGAKAQLDAIRLVVSTAGGVGIGTAVPAALQARPYSIRGALGPVAERWVPVHGLVPLSAAPGTMQALLDYAASTQAERQFHDIALGWLISSKPGHILFEPMLLWRDRLGTQHLRHLPERVTSRAASRPDNAAARAVVDRMRGEMAAILDRNGAIHMQVGRYYRSAGSPEVLTGLKSLFDPARRLNPGSLGL